MRADFNNAQQQLAKIANLSLPDLLEHWRALGLGNPPRLPLPLLQRLLAQLLQEQMYGGFSAKAVRKLDEAAGAAANNTTKSAPSVSSYSSSTSPFPSTSTSTSTSTSALPSNLPTPSKIASQRVSSRQVTLTTGTRLVREWNGRTISVEVVDDHFVWNDAPYRSLSEIARAVTGTRWSGPRFFGIAGRG
jgi:hypothetical protein